MVWRKSSANISDMIIWKATMLLNSALILLNSTPFCGTQLWDKCQERVRKRRCKVRKRVRKRRRKVHKRIHKSPKNHLQTHLRTTSNQRSRNGRKNRNIFAASSEIPEKTHRFTTDNQRRWSQEWILENHRQRLRRFFQENIEWNEGVSPAIRPHSYLSAHLRCYLCLLYFFLFRWLKISPCFFLAVAMLAGSPAFAPYFPSCGMWSTAPTGMVLGLGYFALFSS